MTSTERPDVEANTVASCVQTTKCSLNAAVVVYAVETMEARRKRHGKVK